MKTTVYDVYQYFFHIGRYGENKKIATYNNEEQASKRVDRIIATGQTACYESREVDDVN